MRALVVDDSRAMRTILKRTLVQNGFEVLEAGHGKEALERLAQSPPPPDLMLVDWNMPEMTGLELVTKVRAQEQYSTIRVLMVTTESEMTRVAEALGAGANDYLMKPFTPEGLTDKLRILGVIN